MPCVTILLASHNGAAFLRHQLLSIANQSHTNWRLVVSDDGSDDETKEIVQDFAASCETPDQVSLIDGPQTGESSANFLKLVAECYREGDYIAFCDQDDVWFNNKLERALELIEKERNDTPILYGSRTSIVDENLNEIGVSPLFSGPFCFENALVQSYAGGNTMLMSPQAAQIAWQAAKRAPKLVTHDWFFYQLISGAGGTIIYDSEPTLYYRQHDRNIIGSNMGLLSKFRRIAGLFSGKYKTWNQINCDALFQCGDLLTPKNAACLKEFGTLRTMSGHKALKKLKELALFRQTKSGNVALILGIVIGRI